MRLDAGFLALLVASVVANTPKPAPLDANVMHPVVESPRLICGTPARTFQQEQQMILNTSATQVIEEPGPIDITV